MLTVNIERRIRYDFVVRLPSNKDRNHLAKRVLSNGKV